MQPVTTYSPKTRPQKPKASVDCLELQRLMMDDARKETVAPAVRAQIARAWVDLQEMRLRLAMKPAPKPIDVTDRQAKRKPRSHAIPIEPPSTPAPPQV